MTATTTDGHAGADRPQPRGAAGRVAAAQRQARPTLHLAACFAVAAAVTAVVPTGAGRWLPLHLFLAGGLVLAISGASQLFAVTWSAAPAPPDRLVIGQRWSVAGGVAGLTAARALELPVAATGLSGALYLAGLALLAVLLVRTVRRGVQRRFDVTLRWYLAALSCGGAAAALGIGLAVGATVPGDLRAAHVTMNLLGLVGLVVLGTLPFFVATEARVRMSTRATARHLTRLLAWQAAAVVVAATSLALGHRAPASGALLAYAAGVVAVARTLPRLGPRQLRWAGPRLVHLVAGVAWWAGAVAAMAGAAWRGDDLLPDAVLVVFVVCGLGQVLWGSLAYLLPVLWAGGHERLAGSFRTTRSWVGLVAANLAGVAIVAGAPLIATALVGVWVVDAASRVVLLRWPT